MTGQFRCFTDSYLSVTEFVWSVPAYTGIVTVMLQSSLIPPSLVPPAKPLRKGFVGLLHVGYWALYLLLLTVMFAMVRTQSPSAPRVTTILFASRVGYQLIVPSVVALYLAYGVLVPRFLARKRFGALAIGAIGVALAATAVSVLGILGANTPRGPMSFTVRSLIGYTLAMSGLASIHMTIATVLRGFVEWYDDIAVKDELRRRTAEVESALVRATLDPHFLFNTLNNIDTLISRDPGSASQYLNQLSEMLRFVLYDARVDRVPLDAELAFLEKYVALQRLRLRNPAMVSFAVHGFAGAQRIAPLLLVPFVENAFKHASGQRSDDAIAIEVEVRERSLLFTCSNRYDSERRALPASVTTGGLGNALMRRRLELLYPAEHELSVVDRDERYAVRLTVQLNDSAA